MNLTPFNAPCAACFNIEAEMRYCTKRHLEIGPGVYETVEACGDVPEPHLHRTCKRCGYEWLEQTLGVSSVAHN